MIPVTIVTGCFGSGKTALIQHLHKTGMLENAAVIVQESGEAGLLLDETKKDATVSWDSEQATIIIGRIFFFIAVLLSLSLF
jgi:G3E family GTPase